MLLTMRRVLAGVFAITVSMPGCHKDDGFEPTTTDVPGGFEHVRTIGYVAGTGIVYVARKGDQEFVFRGLQREGPYKSVIGGQVSRDAKSSVYAAQHDQQDLLVKDRKEIAKVSCIDVTLSDDGRSTACMQGDRPGLVIKDGAARWSVSDNAGIWRDGKRIGSGHDSVAWLLFDDRGRVVYAAESNEKWSILRNGQAITSGLSVVTRLAALGDGRVAYQGFRDDNCVVGIEGKESPAFAACGGLFCVGALCAYVSRDKDGRTSVFRNGTPQAQTYDDATMPAVSGDGKHVAFYATRGGIQYAVIDGEEKRIEGARRSGLRLSFDGQYRYSFAQGSEGYDLFVNDKSVGTLSELHAVYPFGQSALFIGKVIMDKVKRFTALVSGKKPVEYDDVADVRISDDGRKVAFVARRGAKLQHVVHAE